MGLPTDEDEESADHSYPGFDLALLAEPSAAAHPLPLRHGRWFEKVLATFDKRRRDAMAADPSRTRPKAVYLCELLTCDAYADAARTLPLALGVTMEGEPYIVDLARMPHLVVAGPNGAAKTAGIDALILSLLHRLSPEQCRFIMVEPVAGNLSAYDGIPHLLAPVITDPGPAALALSWTVREMEDRYRRLSETGARDFADYNQKSREARETMPPDMVFTLLPGPTPGSRICEVEDRSPQPMQRLVLVIDGVVDLVSDAGKDIEDALQRLAELAGAIGVHLIVATDGLKGAIESNFPSRISFQAPDIDSPTASKPPGTTTSLGEGDVTYAAPGGAITKVNSALVSETEVALVVKLLRDRGPPQYLEAVTAPHQEDERADRPLDDGEGLYDRAAALVARDRKASSNYLQRCLQIDYPTAISLIKRLEKEGIVGASSHFGSRDILVEPPPLTAAKRSLQDA